MKKLMIQLIKFGIVGIIATVIDFCVLIFMTDVLKVDVLLSTPVAFIVSLIANYVLIMMFVFKGGKNSKTKEFILFVVLSIGGLILTEALMWLGTDKMGINYKAVKIFVCVIVPVYNFITRKIFLEKKDEE